MTWAPGLVKVSLLAIVLAFFYSAIGASFLISVYALAIMFGLPSGRSPWESSKPWPGNSVGHRGLMESRAPENSLRAIDLALSEKSVEVVEVDVHLSKDGKLVVFHDETLDRMVGDDHFTNGNRVHDYTIEQLWKMRFKDFPHIKEGIPSLEQVLDLVTRKHGARILIEVKAETISWKYYRKVVHQLLDAWDRYHLRDRAVLISFNPIPLYLIRRSNPEIMTGLLYRADIFQKALSMGVLPFKSSSLIRIMMDFLDSVIESISTSWLPWVLGVSFLGPHYKAVSLLYIRNWRRRGVGIYCWTVNDKEYRSYLTSRDAMVAADYFF